MTACPGCGGINCWEASTVDGGYKLTCLRCHFTSWTIDGGTLDLDAVRAAMTPEERAWSIITEHDPPELLADPSYREAMENTVAYQFQLAHERAMDLIRTMAQPFRWIYERRWRRQVKRARRMTGWPR